MGIQTLNWASEIRCRASVRVAVIAVLRHAEKSDFYHGLLAPTRSYLDARREKDSPGTFTPTQLTPR